MLGGIFHFYLNFDRTFYKQTVKTLRSLASDLDLHCLPMSHKKDAMLIWVNFKSILAFRCVSLSACVLVSLNSFLCLNNCRI